MKSLFFFLFSLNLIPILASADPLNNCQRLSRGYGYAFYPKSEYGGLFYVMLTGDAAKVLRPIGQWKSGVNNNENPDLDCYQEDQCEFQISKAAQVMTKSLFVIGDGRLSRTQVLSCKNGEQSYFRILLSETIASFLSMDVEKGEKVDWGIFSKMGSVGCYRTPPAPKDGSDVYCWVDFDVNGKAIPQQR